MWRSVRTAFRFVSASVLSRKCRSAWRLFFAKVTNIANVNVVKDRIRIGCEHYPNRAAVLIMANVPPWVNAAYQVYGPELSVRLAFSY